MRQTLFLISLVITGLGVTAQQTLDPTFGNNGITRTYFPPIENISYSICDQVIALPDGSFYLLIDNNSQQIYLNHRFADGSIDLNYGENGYSVPTWMSGGHAAILPDGKVVIAGANNANDSADFLIVRYNLDGSIDQTFAAGGKRTIDFGRRDYATNIIIQADGKIIAIGYYNQGAGFAIARLNSDGSLDNSFSGDGKQITFLTTAAGIQATATVVTVENSGRIIVAGRSELATVVTAYLPNGEPDNSFGNNGIAKFDLGDVQGPKAVSVQPDGKIIVAGTIANLGVYHVSILHLNANGTPDTSFLDDGHLIIDLVENQSIQDMQIDAGGKILMSGTILLGHTMAMVERLTAEGLPDISFSSDGIATVDVSSLAPAVPSATILTNGKIMIGGTFSVGIGTEFFAARFNADGFPDNSLDNDGLVTDHLNLGFTYFFASAVQADGKIVCAGSTRTQGYASDFVIARFNTNGLLDTTFSHDGFATVRFEPGPFHTGFYSAEAHAIAIQADGRIVLAGFSYNDPLGDNPPPSPTYNYAIARLNPDGSMDNSFSEDGKLITDVFGADDFAYAVAIQPDGKIIAAGSSAVEGSTNFDFSIARYNPDGSLDNSFSWDGKYSTEFFSAHDKASKLLIQPDGKIIAIGTGGGMSWGLWTTFDDLAIARYLPNGYPDNTFGYDGAIRIDIQSSSYDAASDASLLPDGSILIGATRASDYGQRNSEFAIAKLRPNGFLDSSYATNGIKIIPLGFNSEICNAIAIQPNGRIVLGGVVSNDQYPSQGEDIAMIRLFGDATVDNSLSFNGKNNLDLGAAEEKIQSINIANNRIYAVGNSWYRSRVGFVLAFKLDCSLSANIPDAFALSVGVDANTVYKGYSPADDLILSAKVTGKVPFSYLWNTGAKTKSINVSPNNTTTYSVTVTDATGCSQQVSKTVSVIDVRCGNKGEKVLICQPQPGKWGTRKTICLDQWVVAGYLLKGSHLGVCPSDVLTNAKPSSADEEEKVFGIVASPNPTPTQFMLNIKLNGTELAELIIRDIEGRVVDRVMVQSNSVIQIGSRYAAGMYMAELRQGENKVVIKLVKASQ